MKVGINSEINFRKWCLTFNSLTFKHHHQGQLGGLYKSSSIQLVCLASFFLTSQRKWLTTDKYSIYVQKADFMRQSGWQGKDRKMVGSTGNTGLHFSALLGNPDIVAVFLQHLEGADQGMANVLPEVVGSCWCCNPGKIKQALFECRPNSKALFLLYCWQLKIVTKRQDL